MTIHRITTLEQLRTVAPAAGDTLLLDTPELDLESLSHVPLMQNDLTIVGGRNRPTVLKVTDGWATAAAPLCVFLVQTPASDGHVTFENLEFHGGHTTNELPTGRRYYQAIHVRRGRVTVRSCNFIGWSEAGIDVAGTATAPAAATIEDCRFAECRAAERGYGVVVGDASAVIRGNTFYACRHAIASRKERSSAYTAVGNYVVVTEHEPSFDVHGSSNSDLNFEFRLNDEPPELVHTSNTQWIGGRGGVRYEIAGNTFVLLHRDTEPGSHWKVVQIRGIPDEISTIYDNRIVSRSGEKGKFGILAGTINLFQIHDNRRERF